MGRKAREFNEYRARMNERILASDNRVIKRVYSIDSLTYTEGGRCKKRPRSCSAWCHHWFCAVTTA